MGVGRIFRFFFFTQKRFKKFTVFEDQPDNRRKEKTSCPNIEDRKRGFRVTSQLAVRHAKSNLPDENPRMKAKQMEQRSD